MTIFAAFTLKRNPAGDLCKQGIIFANTHICPWMEMGTTLTNEDAASGNHFTGLPFYAKALGMAVTAVAGAANTFFMCK